MESDTRPPRIMRQDITPAQISRMVEEFYAAVRQHDHLGPIFNSRLDGRWPAHLDKLKAFWRSVLLTTGEYNGRPVPAHNGIAELQSEDFALWLNLFDQTIERIFADAQGAEIKDKARRIARSLWFARFGAPFNNPPVWPSKTAGP